MQDGRILVQIGDERLIVPSTSDLRELATYLSPRPKAAHAAAPLTKQPPAAAPMMHRRESSAAKTQRAALRARQWLSAQPGGNLHNRANLDDWLMRLQNQDSLPAPMSGSVQISSVDANAVEQSERARRNEQLQIKAFTKLMAGDFKAAAAEAYDALVHGSAWSQPQLEKQLGNYDPSDENAYERTLQRLMASTTTDNSAASWFLLAYHQQIANNVEAPASLQKSQAISGTQYSPQVLSRFKVTANRWRNWQ